MTTIKKERMDKVRYENIYEFKKDNLLVKIYETSD